MRGAALAFAGILAAGPALAHHPLAGAPMETLAHGLLSGLGHPVLGIDHLFFVVAVGLAAAFTGRVLLAPLAFVGGMLGGVGLIVAGVGLPLVEFAIAGSLILLGGIVLSGRALGPGTAAALFAGLGVFHGWAFGETIAGQESIAGPVIGGYLIGLAAIQWTIAAGAGLAVLRLWRATSAADIRPRLAGAAVAGAGLVFLLEGLEAAALAAPG